MSTSTPTSTGTPNLGASLDQVRGAADEAVGRLRETATTAADLIAEKAPGASSFSQQAIVEVSERIDRNPDEALMLGGVLTAGMWVGMALARAPKWLLVLAVLPTVVVVLAALPRFATSERGRRGA